MKKVTLVLTGLAMLMVSPSAFAYRTNPSDEAKAGGGPSKSASAGCLPPSTSAELNVNNVRSLIHSGGDMWWDLIANPRYEIPKGSGRHSMFLGTLWIAGRDQSTQTLRVAAQRYRSRGVDFWTGPLDRLGTAEIDPETCELYDQIWTITRQQVELFRLCNCIAPDDAACEGYSVPESIRRWPGNPIPQSNGQHLNMEPTLAPFADVNGDGVYRWEDCDYPFYDLDNTIDCSVDRSAFLYGDFTLWWVFNDKGNIHGETQGPPIGMEIRAQGFGFNTNDEINNMTFYNYQLINRGTTTLAQCYFGVNTDADIGGAFDDYTGCDVARGFGFMYNGDAFDENFAGSLGYGSNPPAIGMDFFEGPYLDSNGVAIQFDPADIPNLTDTTRFSGAYAINGLGFNDTIPDNERYGMRRYVYYNNGNCITCDPQNFPEYYNMLRGVWKDNTRMVFGGNGYPAPGNGSTTIIADFMFPGDSDPLNWGTRGVVQPFEWREQNTGAAPNTPGDRRFVQSAGPFTLKPGLVNDITVGVVWARTSTGDPYESVIRVLAADQKAQSLFENCFRVLNGPDAPDMNIVELDRELILYLTNRPTSNNYLEEYDELNYFIPEFDLQTRALTKDTVIWVPAWNRIDTINGDSLYIYNQQVINGNTADTTINVYDSGGNVTGAVYGFLLNPSNAVLTTINLGTTQDTTFFDRQIRFEGYLIYQLRDPTVTATDVFGIDGSTKARLVAQCDITNFDEVGNPIGRIINYQFDEDLNASVPKVMVNGTNEGVVHSFRITEDQFAVGDKRLVNHKTYHFMALAYGYNNFKTFDPNDATMLDGQKEPFFLGRRNIRAYSGIPRIPAPGLGGTILNSLYGTSPPITRVEGRGNGGNDIQLNEETERRILESPEFKTDTLVYELNRGPVNIKVIDPLRVRPANYALKIVGAPTSPQGTILAPTARWILFERNADGTLDTVALSEKDLSGRNEQIIFDRRNIPDVDPFLGFSITIRQPLNLGPFWRTVNGALVTDRERENGFVASSINFRDPFHVWLGFFPDINGPTPANWIRSGTSESTDNPAFNSNFYSASTGGAGNTQTVFIDPESSFERNISFFGGGGIVPYFLVGSATTYSDAPGGAVLPAHQLGALEVIGGSGGVITVAPFRFTIGSVDIVLTPDRSLWSRCPVFETQDFPELAFTDTGLTGQPRKLAIRHSPSVDKWGRKANTSAGASTDPESPNFISPWGYSWFPGYVIDVETGERLNIAFGEDSFLGGVNGRDMLFNPAVTDLSTGQGVISQFGEYLAAGKHFMYIFSSTRPESVFQQGFPRYDHGEAFKEYLLGSNGLPLNNPSVSQRRNLWRNCSWAGIPFHVLGKEWLNNPVRISLRVSKPYERNWTATTQSSEPQNDNRPMYYFNMGELAPVKGDVATARSALDLIQVVPNPYYANSAYETSQLDNRVKIVNLPDVCTITIYALNGTLVRRFEKGTNDLTSIDWDLTNYARIPIASGLYIIHIKAPGIGERIVKWFGVIRPIDLDSF